MKITLTSILIFGVAAFTIACGGSKTDVTINTANSVNKPASTPIPANTVVVIANTNSSPKTETASAGSIGVPECDDYIAKLDACLNSKVPEAARGAFRSQAEGLRKSWKDAAATPQGKAGLAVGCKAASDAAKISLSAYNCAW